MSPFLAFIRSSTLISALALFISILSVENVWASKLRIVSLAPSWSHTVAEIGAIDSLVGVTRYAEKPATVPERVELGKIKIVGGFSDINIADVLALKPDLVLTASSLQLKLLNQLKSRGIKTIHMDESNINGIYDKFRQLGKETNHQDEAEQLISRIKQTLKAVSEHASHLRRPKVYYELNYYYKCVPGNDSPISQLIRIAGGVPLFAEKGGNAAMVEWPEVVAANPDVILIPNWPGATQPVFQGEEKGSGTTTLNEVLSRDGAENINAVKNGRVWYIDSATTKQPGPNLIEAAWLFSETIFRQN